MPLGQDALNFLAAQTENFLSHFTADAFSSALQDDVNLVKSAASSAMSLFRRILRDLMLLRSLQYKSLQWPVTAPVTVVDPKGNAVPVAVGQQVQGSKDGKYVQVKDSLGIQLAHGSMVDTNPPLIQILERKSPMRIYRGERMRTEHRDFQ